MLTHEIHTRIMLNELREILIDPERPHGGHLPSEMADGLDLDSVTSFLVAADWFEQQGSELENLIRTHCELIELMPMDWCLSEPYVEHNQRCGYEDGYWVYPFASDWNWCKHVDTDDESYRRDLMESRLRSYNDLYGILHKYDYKTNLEGVTVKLGRTTRMLTDVIRRCGLYPRINTVQIVSTQNLDYELVRLIQTVVDPGLDDGVVQLYSLWGTELMCFRPNDPRIFVPTVHDVGITYTVTDHYVIEQWRRQQQVSDFYNPILQRFENSFDRNLRIQELARRGGRVQYDPSIAFNPASLIPDNETPDES